MTTLSHETPAAVRIIEPTRNADPYREMDLLRLSTAGSVDDGKSTLIGRLLFDTKSIFEDQLDAIEAASRRRGEGYVNLALLTDGLRAEREQNITIDVAYRYFATPRRKFIIADTPGHVQYTRNMVTGASTADLAIVLVDARKGVITQTRRHAFISTLLGIPHMVVAVNKMDLVDYDEGVFRDIVATFTEFASKLEVADVVFIPISALLGDNVVTRTENTPWYEGTTLLHHLESVNVAADRNLLDFRFPVQYVVRPHQDYRGFAGRIASGTISPGEQVVVLPAGRTSTIKSIDTAAGEVTEGVQGDSVVITLADEIDISRGDMIVRRGNLPSVDTRFDALICWMSEQALQKDVSYVLMHTNRTVKAYVNRVVYRIDVDTLHRESGAALGLNDIGRVEIATGQPIFFDPYMQNLETGSFILVDPFSNATVAAGMIRGPVRTERDIAPALGVARSPNVVWQDWNIPGTERAERNGHRALVVWITGLSGSGKSTIARDVERRLFDEGYQTMLLDGDQLRHGLNGDLGFGASDRKENIRRAAEVASLFYHGGAIVICTFVSPFAADRDFARSLIAAADFVEVFIDTPLAECRKRDPKGLYQRADEGMISQMPGLDTAYEAPTAPQLKLDGMQPIQTNVTDLLSLIHDLAPRLPRT